MKNPLANPLRSLVDDAGGRPEATWKAAASGAGIIGALLARKVLTALRRRTSKRAEVPLNPADERMSWPYALAWTGVVGIVASVGRLLAQFVVAWIWKWRKRRPVAAMPSPTN